MTDYIRLTKADGTYSVRAAGAVLGESANVIELHEGTLGPVLYVPREDLAMAFFDETDFHSSCPHKGDATYYTIQAKSGPIQNAAWSYEDPQDGLERIKGHLAFYTDKVTLEAV
ncbi:MAG: DUF427 domain-containing protein [Pseudomonadota bacterium]